MATEDSSTRFRKSVVRTLPSAALSVLLLIVSPPVPLQESARGQEMTTEIVVTNDSDVENGDSSSVGGLFADPGPDGISLVEAIHATNNDPGTYTIRFDPSLAGATIETEHGMPELTGGNVTIDGDIDASGTPDVTLSAVPEVQTAWGFTIASSGNHLEALTLRDFGTGVQLQPSVDGVSLPTNQTYADNAVTNMVILGVGQGIAVQSGACPSYPERCEAHNTWTNTTVVGNTIVAQTHPAHGDDPRGIRAFMIHSGDRFENATITDNTVELIGSNTDTGIAVSAGGDATDSHVTDVLIARNSIEGSVGIGIHVNVGGNRGNANTTEDVRVIDNQLHLVREGSSWFCCQGIVVDAGSDSPQFAIGPPVRYLDDNLVRNVVVRNNKVTGTLQWGITLSAGIGGGGRRNRVKDVRVIDNIFRSTKPTFGAFIWTGDGDPYQDRYATDNKISGIVLKSNRMKISRGRNFHNAGGGVGAAGIAMMGGHKFGRGNLIRDVRIRRNVIRSPYIGIKVIGGIGETARSNRVICVPRRGNSVMGARKKLLVRNNLDGATDNRVRLRRC